MPAAAIKRLEVEGFGPFRKLNVELSPQLNVVVGDNATGKTQLLKLLYACTDVAHRASEPTKVAQTAELTRKLLGVFRPDSLGRLTNRTRGRTKALIAVKYQSVRDPLELSFSTASRSVELKRAWPVPLKDTPVFLPSRELLSMYPGFAALYATREVEFDETWRDTALLLSLPSLRGARGNAANDVVLPLIDTIGGTIFEEKGRFYMRAPGVGTIEAHLMAEGHRKLAMLIRLVQSGVLLQGGYLFWDEPEANLNPASQVAVARMIATLAKQGSQVIVATHSLFLLRELGLGSTNDQVETRFIGLSRDDGGVTAQSVTDVAELETLTSLEQETDQSIRFLNHV